MPPKPEKTSADKKGKAKVKSFRLVLGRLRTQLLNEEKNAQRLHEALKKYDFYPTRSARRGDSTSSFNLGSFSAPIDAKLKDSERRIVQLKDKIYNTEWLGPLQGMNMSAGWIETVTEMLSMNLVLQSAVRKSLEAEIAFTKNYGDTGAYLYRRVASEKAFAESIVSKVNSRLPFERLNKLMLMPERLKPEKPTTDRNSLQKLHQNQLRTFDSMFAVCKNDLSKSKKIARDLAERNERLEKLKRQVDHLCASDFDKVWQCLRTDLQELSEFMDNKLFSVNQSLNSFNLRLISTMHARASLQVANSIQTFAVIEQIIASIENQMFAREANAIACFLEPAKMAKTRMTASGTKRCEEKYKQLKALLRSSKIDTEEELDTIYLTMDDLMQTVETFRAEFCRRRNSYWLLLPENQQAGDIINRTLSICQETWLLADSALQKLNDNLIQQLKDQNNDGQPKESLSRSSEQQMVRILKFLDCLLSHEVWIIEDIAFLRTLEPAVRFDIVNGMTLKAYKENEMERFQLLLPSIDASKQILERRRKELAFAMTVANVHESAHDRALRSGYEYLLQPDDAQEKVDISPVFEHVAPGVVRAIALLIRLESMLEVANPEIGQSNSPTFHLPESDRDDCRKVLAVLLETEMELRFKAKAISDEETEKMWLWQKRVLVAEKVGDPYLALQANRRKEIHEAVLASLEPGHNVAPFALPEAFEEACTIVERIENKCGLAASPILKGHSYLFALSLFDRILFLTEQLMGILECEAHAPEELAEQR